MATLDWDFPLTCSVLGKFTHVLLREVMVVGQGRGELDVVNVVPQLWELLACHLDHVVSEGGLKYLGY